ncbi:diguanylate cyclase (GGDEF)-like protein/PAS domain S-box-containing protein [Halomonas fontilapidosi]|uniref:Diguanylate cyclase (GGDEF)-like protein/PAS domain S-box-containing protein n=1 Tax=Halomonas fontilapidosi TaxID=616675 RepID=A0A7W5DMB4_9GAMM|nr:sensor domain-containing diguanylate cyclase [Halomonas fontilapidosi]MBB3185471.1 diguanylate cyclase (GGDEF)-like protein/PAS domain S-box-containing protein [Halomonas fontilapidosi]
MTTASSSTRYIRRLHLRIRSLAALGILTTALLAGLVTALPFYHAARSSIEHISQLGANAQAEALHHQLKRYQDITRQLTGRTEIRRRLAAYARGEVSRDALSAFTTPRLADAMAQAPDMAGLIRQGPDGELISRIGKVPDDVTPSHTPQDGYPCRLYLLAQGDVLVQSCSSIVSPEGERLGRDIVFFQAEPLLALLADTQRFGEDARMRLRTASGQQELTLGPQGRVVERVDSPQRREETLHVTLNAPLGEQDWQLLVTIPSQRFRNEALQLLLWPALAILLLALTGSWIVSRALQPLLARVDRQAHELESSQQKLRLAASVFRSAHEAIAITSPSHTIIDANPAFASHLGYSAQALIGRPMKALLAWNTDSLARLKHGLQQLEQNGSWQGEVRYRCANGDTLVALQTVSAVRNGNGETLRYIHIFNDVTEQRAAEEMVRHQALHDELTGLPNRAQLEHHLDRAIRQSSLTNRLLAVFFMDLDHFKAVNDTLGHQAGDTLLQAVSARLLANLRAEDMLARLGGDEFVIVVDSLHAADNATRVAANVVEALTTPFTINGTPVTIGVSVGIALYPNDGNTSETLLQAADAAMYRAKAAGRNTWCLYSPPALPKT